MRRAPFLAALLLGACTLQPSSERQLEGQMRQINEALTRQPENAPLIYYFATLHDQAGNGNEVVHWLERLEQLGWNHGVNPADFRRTKSEGFRQAVSRLNAREPRVSKAMPAFRVAKNRDLVPEGITYDPVDGVFYLSGMHRRKVLRVDRNGNATEFVREGQDGMLSALGMKVDPQRRLLWIASSALDDVMSGWSTGDTGHAALYAYDLRTGQLVNRIAIGDATSQSLLNDLAIAADGTVYVTDSTRGVVHRLTPDSNTLDLWLEGFTYPNGIVLDGRTLYVADFRGITRVSIDDKSRSLVQARSLIGGIDGLAMHRGKLIAVQNGVGNPRVLRIDVQSGSVEILESRNDAFDMPTTGVVVNDEFYFIANSQLRAKAGERVADPVILRLAL